MSGDQTFVKWVGHDYRVWCGKGERSLRAQDKRGAAALQFFALRRCPLGWQFQSLDGHFMAMQIIVKGKTAAAGFDVPPSRESVDGCDI